MIHGLWPDYYNGSYPENCNGPDYKKLYNIKNDLEEYWYDCSKDESNKLWEHEWNKHGKCVYQQEKLIQIEYFNKTIELFKKYQPNTNICFDLSFENISCDEINTIHSY
jgi:ribonuclease T2